MCLLAIGELSPSHKRFAMLLYMGVSCSNKLCSSSNKVKINQLSNKLYWHWKVLQAKPDYLDVVTFVYNQTGTPDVLAVHVWILSRKYYMYYIYYILRDIKLGNVQYCIIKMQQLVLKLNKWYNCSSKISPKLIKFNNMIEHYHLSRFCSWSK